MNKNKPIHLKGQLLIVVFVILSNVLVFQNFIDAFDSEEYIELIEVEETEEAEKEIEEYSFKVNKEYLSAYNKQIEIAIHSIEQFDFYWLSPLIENPTPPPKVS